MSKHTVLLKSATREGREVFLFDGNYPWIEAEYVTIVGRDGKYAEVELELDEEMEEAVSANNMGKPVYYGGAEWYPNGEIHAEVFWAFQYGDGLQLEP